MQIDMRGQRGLYLHAWWDETAIAVCNPNEFNERTRAEGLLEGEFVAAAMPFRGPADADEPPWGILRVGILSEVPELSAEESVKGFRNLLARAYVAMLHTLTNPEIGAGTCT